MRSFRVYLVFGLLSLAMAIFCAFNFSRINGELYGLLQIAISPKNEIINNKLSKSLSQNMRIFSDNAEVLDYALILQKKHEIFSQMQINLPQSANLSALNELKFASFSRESFNALKADPHGFFRARLKEIFSIFSFSAIGLEKDLFGLASSSSFLQNGAIKADLRENRFVVYESTIDDKSIVSPCLGEQEAARRVPHEEEALRRLSVRSENREALKSCSAVGTGAATAFTKSGTSISGEDRLNKDLLKASPKKYYFGSFVLKENLSNDKFLAAFSEWQNFAKDKNAEFLAQSGAAIAAISQKNGEKEGAILGAISLLCVGALLWLGFCSVRVFWVLAVVGFGLLCALFTALLFLPSLHILSVVISVSLVGIMVDFAMHWLGANVLLNSKSAAKSSIFLDKILSKSANLAEIGHRKKACVSGICVDRIESKRAKNSQEFGIKIDSIKFMRRVFLLGLLITTSGYAVFFFSPMRFLHEVALLAIGGLLGSFCASYFLLPRLLAGGVFAPHTAFMRFLFGIVFFARKILARKFLFFFAFLLLLLCGSVGLLRQDFSDKVENYMNLSDEFLSQSARFAKLSGQNISQKVVFLDIDFSGDLTEDLVQKERTLQSTLGLESSEMMGLGRFLLSKEEQIELKNIFKENYEAILNEFVSMGISQKLVQNALNEVLNAPILGAREILFSENFSKFTENLSEFLVIKDNEILGSLVFISADGLQNAPLHEILSDKSAQIIDFKESINESFTKIKANAIALKCAAFAVGLVILSLFLGFARAAFITGLVLLASLGSAAVVGVLGLYLNVFGIFGLILSSAMGVDYLIFAQSSKMPRTRRIFGILLAAFTSFISFGLLGFCSIYAVSIFGICTAIGILFNAFIAICVVSKFK